MASYCSMKIRRGDMARLFLKFLAVPPAASRGAVLPNAATLLLGMGVPAKWSMSF